MNKWLERKNSKIRVKFRVIGHNMNSVDCSVGRINENEFKITMRVTNDEFWQLAESIAYAKCALDREHRQAILKVESKNSKERGGWKIEEFWLLRDFSFSEMKNSLHVNNDGERYRIVEGILTCSNMSDIDSQYFTMLLEAK